MRILVWLILFVALSAGVSYADIFVEYFSIGSERIKAVHMNHNGRLIINYFKKDATAQDVKYRYAGVEVFVEGVKVKDTFQDNDR